MAQRLTTLGGILLAVLVAVGTELYIRGIAPAFPVNALAFNLVLLLCIAYALLFGCRHSKP